MSRDIRRLNNSTERMQSFSIGAPSSSLQEGGTFVSIENGNLAVYRKHKGIEFKSYMSRKGDQIVDKKLTAGELEYKNRFIDYRYFMHNFTDDINASEVYIPWQGTGEQSSMNVSTTAFLVPFNMTLQKIIIRPEALSNTSADIRVYIKKQDNDETADNICVADYTTTLVAHTAFTLTKENFDSLPFVEAGDKCAISMTASTDPSGEIDWYVTSVWRVEVTI